jgi:phosphatidylethanolamine/phosphatidyl-N-methylethanolamine N-methyltransferase
MTTFSFLKEAINNMKTVGSVKPSSPQLCEAMIKGLHHEIPQTIVELGAGEGAITRMLLERMHSQSHLIAFEINQNFLSTLREIHDPRLTLVNDSALHIHRHLQRMKIEEADAIVSALPLVLFEKELAQKILEECYRTLKHGAVFAQFNYSYFNKKMYERVFDSVKVRFVLNNLPPAFVFRCKKK